MLGITIVQVMARIARGELRATQSSRTGRWSVDCDSVRRYAERHGLVVRELESA